MTIDWKVIIDPKPRKQAEQELVEWMARQAELGRAYGRDEIREDVILSEDRTTLIRYAVQAESE
jgi:hypothetical protein